MIPLNKCHKYKRMVLAYLLALLMMMACWFAGGVVMRYQSFQGVSLYTAPAAPPPPSTPTLMSGYNIISLCSTSFM